MAFLTKTLLKKIAFRKSVGIYLGENKVSVSHFGSSPLGSVELSSEELDSGPESLGDELPRIVKPYTDKRGRVRVPVAIGIPALRVFFSTRALKAGENNVNPRDLLHEQLQSSTVNVDDMEVDMMKGTSANTPVASLISCRRKYLSSLMTTLTSNGVRPYRAEPAPFSLLRLAASKHRAPRKSKGVIRVFLGTTHGVAMLVAGDLPTTWRMFELVPGQEGNNVRAVAKALQIVGRYRAELPTPDALMIHGRPDLESTLEAEEFSQTLDMKSMHFPGPEYNGPAVALGLAMGCQPSVVAFDLFRETKPRAPLWEVIPFSELALQVSILVCIALFLQNQLDTAQTAFRKIRLETAKHAWMEKVADDKLETEKKALEQKVDTIRQYLESRTLWTHYTREATARLPDNIQLKLFNGVSELAIGPGKKKKNSLLLSLVAPVPLGQSTPKEIDDYFHALRKDPLLQRDLPSIEMAEMRWTQPTNGGTKAKVEFTISCLPKVEKAVAKKTEH